MRHYHCLISILCGALIAACLPALAADVPAHGEADLQLGNESLKRARLQAEAAAQSLKTAPATETLLVQARAAFAESQNAFAAAEKRLAEAARKFSKINRTAGSEDLAAQDAILRELLHVRLVQALAAYEVAWTYDPNSRPYRQGIRAAAARFENLFRKYPKYYAGLLGRLEAARCYKELGDAERALDALGDVLAGCDDAEAFGTLRNKAYALGIETCLLPGVDDYQSAAAKAEAWRRTARAEDQASEEGQMIRYWAGVAWAELARELSDDPGRRVEAATAARQFLTPLSRAPGVYQEQAKMKLADALGATADAARPIKAELTTLAEADRRGQEALDRMQAADVLARREAARGSLGNRHRWLRQKAEARDDAVYYFSMALHLAPRGTPVDDVNLLRYYLAYLHWNSNQPEQAAVLGEFLIERYPESAVARPAAKVALAACMQLVADAPSDEDRRFQTARARAVAERITQRWPQSPEADDAWLVLVHTALRSDDSAAALGCLQQVPPDAPRRSEIQQAAGRGLWAAYLRALARPEAQRPPQADLDKMLDAASQSLTSALDHIHPAGTTDTQAEAARGQCLDLLAEIQKRRKP